MAFWILDQTWNMHDLDDLFLLLEIEEQAYSNYF